MVLAFAVLVGLALGALLGGSPRRLANLRLRALPLFYAAVALQIVAFPFAALPWTTSDGVADSHVAHLLRCPRGGGGPNWRVAGVLVVAAGMASNVLAIAANGGHMPVLPEAVRAAGGYVVQFNSEQAESPRLAWLIDRWAAPDWLPWANVFSVGDVVIALGATIVVAVAMEPRLAGARRPHPHQASSS